MILAFLCARYDYLIGWHEEYLRTCNCWFFCLSFRAFIAAPAAVCNVNKGRKWSKCKRVFERGRDRGRDRGRGRDRVICLLNKTLIRNYVRQTNIKCIFSYINRHWPVQLSGNYSCIRKFKYVSIKSSITKVVKSTLPTASCSSSHSRPRHSLLYCRRVG